MLNYSVKVQETFDVHIVWWESLIAVRVRDWNTVHYCLFVLI